VGCCRYGVLFKNIFLSLVCCSSCPVVVVWTKDPQWRL
ncbi:hypothetical protein N332_08286, partial [Mesitornis unicolor]